MSTNVTSCVEVGVAATAIDAIDNTVGVSASNCSVEIGNADTVVKGYKNEYSIVGDGLYASINYDEAPTWLTSIIDTVVDYAVAGSLTNYASLTQDIRDAVSMLDVAANSYVEKINFASSVDGIVASHLTTLNATLGNTYTTLVELDTMVANTEYALAMQVADLRASYTDDINSEITAIRTAYADADSALASDITALTSVFASQESTISGMSDAVTGLQTYVGLTESGDPDGTGLLAGIEALSSWVVNLENEVTGETGHVALAMADLQTTSKVYADNIGARAENKFAYDSTIMLDGVYYTSGFGLTAVGTTGSGTELDPYNSEFWIDAEKFKFTNGNQTGTTAPFTIDASGTTPKITFNGIVSFSNVSGTSNLLSAGDSISSLTNNVGYTDDTAAAAAQNTADLALAAATNVDVSGDISSNNDLMAQKLGYTNYADMVSKASSGKTIISGGYLNADVIAANTAITSPAITGGSVTGTTFNNGSGTFTVDANGGVTAKNLVIKNAAGQVILSSGTGAEWDYVNGRPTSLATLNSTDGSRLASVAYGADVTDYTDTRVSNDAIEIGSRNLLRGSDTLCSNTSYALQSYSFGNEIPVEGKTYTISLKGAVGSDRIRMSVYTSGGYRSIATFAAADFNGYGVATKTVTMRFVDGKTPADGYDYITMYQIPSSGVTASTIEWIKLEEGNKRTTWTPAPEDVEAAYQAYATAATEAEQVRADAYADGVVTTAEQNAIDAAQEKADAAEANAKSYTEGWSAQGADVTDYVAIAADAQTKADAARAAAEAYALAKANLAQTEAEAHADGIVTAEETRAIADATAKADAAKADAISTAKIYTEGWSAQGADVTNYTDYRVSNSSTEGNVTTITNPQGGSFSSAGSTTGAIVITLPQSWTNTMMKMEIDVFLYAQSSSFKVQVGGYNYTGSSWVNEFAQIVGNTASNNRVRLGHNGTKCCIVIGDTTSVWAYPKVSVKNFQAGHSNSLVSQWATGWDVSILPNLTGYTFTGDFSDALLDAKSIIGQGALATQNRSDLNYEDGADVTATSSFVTSTYPTDKANILGLIDGKIDTWYTSSDPSISWTGTNSSHEGDMWWNTSTNKLKRYSGTAWSAELTDQKAIDAYTNAATAQDTADGKRRVFVTTPTVPYDTGDLWDRGATLGIWRCKTSSTVTYSLTHWQVVADVKGANKSYDTYRVGGTTSVVTANNKITSANISTYIANLAVDTLKIGENAVTVTRSFYMSSPIAAPYPGDGSEYHFTTAVASVPITLKEDGDININFSCLVTGIVGTSSISIGVYSSATGTDLLYSAGFAAPGPNCPVAFSLGVEQPKTAEVTYTVRMSASGAGTAIANRSLIVLGTLR